MVPDLWLPGVQRLDCSAYGLALGKGNNDEAYHTWHSFEGIPKDYNFSALRGAEYLARTLKLAHFVFNPVLGGLVQLLPANVAARTLAATTDPRYDVNRRGRRHMQTEVIANAARPFTLDMTRAGLDDLTRLMNFLRAHGVEDQWAWEGQPPPVYPGPGVPRRMPTRSGHAYHAGWPVPPGVTPHGDPGAIAAPWTIVGTTRPSPAPPPRAPEWPEGWIAHAQELLNALGYTDADGRELAVDDSLGPATEHATRSYQADAGLDVDGRPGADTTASLEETMSKIDDVLTRLDSLPADVWRFTIGAEGAQARSWLRGGNLKAGRASDAAQESVAKIGALEAAVSALATGKGADPEAIREAARQGAADALAGITVTVGVEE